MKTFKHRFVVKSDLDSVWKFYTDIGHLKIITPKEMDLRIIDTSNQNIVLGQEVWIRGRIVGKEKIWHSKITSFKAYEYVDDMLKGPFKKWRHIHRFQKIDSNTEVIDEVYFELPYGILGKLFEGYAHNKLQKIFEYRKMATIDALENR